VGLLGHGRAGYFGRSRESGEQAVFADRGRLWFDIVVIYCDPGDIMSVHFSVVVIR